MSQLEKEIAQKIWAIANKGREGRFPVMSGNVVQGSVNESEGTCTVELSVNDESSPTEGVLINAVLSNTNGLILYPRDNSYVWVAELDGPGKFGLVKCSDLLKMVVKINNMKFTIESGKVEIDAAGSKLYMDDDGLTMNDGSYNGVPISANVASKITAVAADINQLKGLFTTLISTLAAAAIPASGSTPVTAGILSTYFSSFTSYAASALTLPTAGELSNDKVKHGV